MDIHVLLSQMVQLFSLLVLGFILCRLRIMNADFNQRLNKLVMNVTLPALIIHAVLQQQEGGNEMFFTFLRIAVLMYLTLPLAGFLLAHLLRTPQEEQGLYMFMTVYSNVGFMGYPVIEAIYGTNAIFHAAIFNLIFNLSAFTIGVFIIRYGRGGTARFDFRRLLTPGMLASVFAILAFFLHLSLPKPVEGFLDTVGSMTTPLAMLLIGSTLGLMDPKAILNEKRMYPYAVLKQIGLPLLIWFVVSRFVHDPYIIGITVVLAAMPVANNSVLFATEFDCDEQLAAKNVFLTTLLSIVTVPLVAYICGL